MCPSVHSQCPQRSFEVDSFCFMLNMSGILALDDLFADGLPTGVDCGPEQTKCQYRVFVLSDWTY